MNSREEAILSNLFFRHKILLQIKDNIVFAYELIKRVYTRDNKLLVAGNGGSSSDAEHLVAELMKSFRLKRPIENKLYSRLKNCSDIEAEELCQKLEQPIEAIALGNHGALASACINDIGADYIYAQQLLGLGNEGDVFLAISTSGNSQNINNAVILAKAMGLETIGLTGSSGGRLSQIVDLAVKVPASETFEIQEMHIPIYHCWCMMLEEAFFSDAEA